MQNQDETFMAAALECAVLGRGAVEPNPMVGALLVKDGREIARGWHRRFGGPHAEVEALAAAGPAARGATAYVTLEPCCHYGKTPPCAGALIKAGVSRVVAAMEDPDSRVAGKGLAALRQAGIEVQTGVCEAAARQLLAAYIKLRTQGRPWVIAKWAQTADGFLALPPGQGRWVSSPAARDEVHRLRGLCDGIAVGVGTVLADDPLLNNRSGGGKGPVRLVLDSRLRTPADSRLVVTARQWPVIIACADPDAAAKARLQAAGVEVLALPAAAGGGVDLPALLDELGRRQWTYLLVEGGAKVLRSFIKPGLADEIIVFTSGHACGAAGDLPRFDIQANRAGFSLISQQTVGGDLMQQFRRA